MCRGKRSKLGATWGDVLGYDAARGYGAGMGPRQPGLGIAALALNTLSSMGYGQMDPEEPFPNPCHLGHSGSSAPVLTENALSPALPLMLLYLLLLAAGVLRTAFPHLRSGKTLISDVGLGVGEKRLLCLLWLLPARWRESWMWSPQLPRGQHGNLGPKPWGDKEGFSAWPLLGTHIFLEAFWFSK